jgi:Nickel/cobalt transporter regulator
VLRLLAVAATLLLLSMSSLVFAQQNQPQGPEHRPAGRPPGPPPHGAPQFAPHGPPGGFRPPGPVIGAPHGPLPGGPPGAHFGGPAGPAGQFIYRGHPFHQLHIAPFIYPPGFVYRRWAVGAVLPPVFLAPDYYYADWAALGLDPPPPGTEWVRYGPDLLLVDVTSGQVLDVVYDVFY